MARWGGKAMGPQPQFKGCALQICAPIRGSAPLGCFCPPRTHLKKEKQSSLGVFEQHTAPGIEFFVLKFHVWAICGANHPTIEWPVGPTPHIAFKFSKPWAGPLNFQTLQVATKHVVNIVEVILSTNHAQPSCPIHPKHALWVAMPPQIA